MYLASLTWKKLEEKITEETVALIPLGSVEQHGPLAPLGTDYFIPEEFAKRVEAAYRIKSWCFLPCLWGLSLPCFLSGTIDMGIEFFRSNERTP